MNQNHKSFEVLLAEINPEKVHQIMIGANGVKVRAFYNITSGYVKEAITISDVDEILDYLISNSEHSSDRDQNIVGGKSSTIYPGHPIKWQLNRSLNSIIIRITHRS